MNRIFVFLVLAGASVALLLDLFGAPVHVAPGAVVDAASQTRIVSAQAPAGTTLVVEAAAEAENGEAQIRLKALGAQGSAPRVVVLTVEAMAPHSEQLLDAEGNVVLKLTSETGSTASQIAAGLVRLKTLGPGAKRAPHLAKVTEGMLEMASVAAKLALGLIGILALWMGVLRVAEAGGVVNALARLLRPVLVRLFPEIPPDHPAMGAMVMNIAANLLGLGNAATPLGLEAMKRLQELNPHKRTASNAMVLFLAINTSGLTLLPTKTIALRAENGSADPVAILVPTLLATAASTIIAIFMAKLLAPRFPLDDDTDEADGQSAANDKSLPVGGDAPATESPR